MLAMLMTFKWVLVAMLVLVLLAYAVFSRTTADTIAADAMTAEQTSVKENEQTFSFAQEDHSEEKLDEPVFSSIEILVPGQESSTEVTVEAYVTQAIVETVIAKTSSAAQLKNGGKEVEFEIDISKDGVKLTEREFFESFYEMAGKEESNVFLKANKSKNALDVLGREYPELYKLSTYKFATGRPRAFFIPKINARVVAIPMDVNVNLVLLDDLGVIKMIFPFSEPARNKSNHEVATFKPTKLNFTPGFVYSFERDARAHVVATERYQELVKVKEGKLDPVFTFMHLTKQTELQSPFSLIKGRDFTREVETFNRLWKSADVFFNKNHSRSVIGFCSGLIHQSIKSSHYALKGFNGNRFLVLKSVVDGYNFMLIKRKTSSKEYVQFVYVKFPENMDAILSGKERPFLEPVASVFSFDSDSPETKIVVNWLKENNVSVPA